jgi:hypothetical protein
MNKAYLAWLRKLQSERFFVEFATIIGIGTETPEDQDALNYAVNVCKRLFPHHIQILN